MPGVLWAAALGPSIVTDLRSDPRIERQRRHTMPDPLIELFAQALGLQIEWQLLLSRITLVAIGTSGTLLAVREIVARRWLPTGGDGRSFLLLCPNLTIVALAAKAMRDIGTDAKATAWLVLTGLFTTVVALALLPVGNVVVAHRVDDNSQHSLPTQ